MNDELGAIFTVLMGYSFHDDSPAASWFRANKDLIPGEYTLTGTGPYQKIVRPEYEAVASDIDLLDGTDISQALTLLGLPTSTLVSSSILANLVASHHYEKEELPNGLWRLRYPKYQPQVSKPKRPKVLQPGEEFHLIDLLDGTAVLPEDNPDIELKNSDVQWVEVHDLSRNGTFGTIRDRVWLYRIAAPKRKPLPSEVSALLDEVPELKIRLTELGYDLGQPVRAG